MLPTADAREQARAAIEQRLRRMFPRLRLSLTVNSMGFWLQHEHRKPMGTLWAVTSPFPATTPRAIDATVATLGRYLLTTHYPHGLPTP